MRFSENQVKKYEGRAREVADMKEYPGRMILFAVLNILIAIYMELRNRGDTLKFIAEEIKQND